jgi:hypothetical protein
MSEPNELVQELARTAEDAAYLDGVRESLERRIDEDAGALYWRVCASLRPEDKLLAEQLRQRDHVKAAINHLISITPKSQPKEEN